MLIIKPNDCAFAMLLPHVENEWPTFIPVVLEFDWSNNLKEVRRSPNRITQLLWSYEELLPAKQTDAEAKLSIIERRAELFKELAEIENLIQSGEY